MCYNLIGLFIACLIGAVIGAFCWPYSINTLLVLAGKEPSVLWWQGALIGFVPYIGHFAIPVAVVVWVITLFVG